MKLVITLIIVLGLYAGQVWFNAAMTPADLRLLSVLVNIGFVAVLAGASSALDRGK